MKEVLNKLFSRRNLTREEAHDSMDQLMQGKASPEQIAGFLGALRGKGETIQEICGFVESMREHALHLPIKRSDLIDTCGTGGDGANTFNISTTSAFIVAAAGAGVCKHGNRSISSKCGSADVLEELGVPITLNIEQASKSVDQIGFGFLFARTMHPSMGHVAPVRAALGVRTIFNVLGPLTNPANTKRQIIGVYDANLLNTVAEVLKELGSKEVMVVHGEDGLDEVTLTGKTQVAHLKNGHISRYTIHPENFDLSTCSATELKGGDAQSNAQTLLGILQGSIKGPKRDIVVLNAGCALSVIGAAANINSGCRLAENLIDDGKAHEILEKAKVIA